MHQVRGNRGRADGQAHSEQVQASPHRGSRRFRYQAPVGPAERHGGHEVVGYDRAAKKQQRLSGGWDPARVGEDGAARPDGEGVAVGGGACGDSRAQRRPVPGQHRTIGVADLSVGLPGRWRLASCGMGRV